MVRKMYLIYSLIVVVVSRQVVLWRSKADVRFIHGDSQGEQNEG
jgi:hypothetical protein